MRASTYKKYGYVMGYQVSHIVVSLYLHGCIGKQRFRYVDDTVVTIKTKEVSVFSEHNSSVYKNITFTRRTRKKKGYHS